MRWNGEDHANAIAPAGPTALSPDSAGPFDRALWFDRLAAMHWAGTPRRDAHGSAAGSDVWLPLVAPAPGARVSLANWYSFAFRPQFSGSTDPAAQAMALTDLFGTLRQSAAQLDLFPVPEVDGSSAMLRNALLAAGWWVTAQPEGHSHWLDLAGLSHDQWWADRPGALRSTVARKGKKGIVDICIVAHCDPEIWAAYERIYAASWKPGEGNPALLRAFAGDEGQAGRIRLGLASIDGVPVAAQFWTVENGCAFIHKLAHVEDSVKASPGTLLTAALFRHVIDIDGVRRVDFGTGNDPYKRDWMNRHNRLWRIRAFNPSRPTVWPAAVAAMIRNRRHSEES
jgi:Acetyltransferase (GNAT) domain